MKLRMVFTVFLNVLLLTGFLVSISFVVVPVYASSTFTGQVGASTSDCGVYDYDEVTHPPWTYLESTIALPGIGYETFGIHYYYRGVGAVFSGVTIPNGATINAAVLSLCASASESVALNVRLAAELSTSSAAFSTVADYNGRSRTSYVAWSSVSAWTAETWYNSSDISAAVQSVVNQAAWASGNNMAIFCEISTDSYGLRYCYQYDSAAAKAPKLYVTYTSDTTAPTSTVPAAPYNTTLAGAVCNFSCQWTDETALSKATLETNNTGALANATWLALSGAGPSWANFTVTLNSTAGFVVQYKWYCNDTKNNMAQTNTSGVYMTLTLTASDSSAPTYSLPSPSYNETKAGYAANFSCYWNDDTNITAVNFCTNNTGAWVNTTMTAGTNLVWNTTTGAWANYTITLNTTVGVVVAYLWNASDAVPNWNTSMTSQYVTTTFYASLTINTPTHSFSVNPGDNNITVTEGTISITVTSNANFDVEAKAGGNLVNGSYSITIGNLLVSQSALGSAINMTTEYQDIPGLTNQAGGTALAKTFVLWLSVPNGTLALTYTYTLTIKVSET